MNTKTKNSHRFLSISSVVGLLLVSFLYLFLNSFPAQAAINEQINYQGRLLDNTGGVVADGNYNMRFKIYQDGNGCVGGGSSPCGGSLEWTETRQNSASQGVVVKNGYYSVNLGSITAFGTDVDWNQGTLWLSIDVGGTGTGGSPTYSGELLPFRRIASVPQAFNSSLFNGLQSTNFVQLAQGVQADGSTSNASIFINKTGGTADILNLQRAGTSVMLINNGGSTAFKTTTDSATGFQVNDADGGTPVLNVDTDNERVGVGTAAPEALLEVQGAEATNATILLDADDGDDAADSWFVSSLAADNSLSFRNDATEVANLTSSGNLQIDGALTLGTDLAVTEGGTGSSTSQGAINNLSQLTTNGDLLYHNGTNSTRLARGANGECLTSNATTLVWGSCSSGGSTLQSAYDATSGNTITLTNARDLTFTAPDTATDPNIIHNLAGAGDFNIQDAGITRFSINDAGQMISGGGSPFMDSLVPGFTQFTLNKDASYAAQAFQVASTTAAESGVFFGARSRGTVASPTESQNGDTLFQIAATGYTTSNALANLSNTNPTLQFVQDAASTATAAPAALIYKPAANGASALHIPSSGSVFLGKADSGVNVTIGDGSASATPDLFVLDQKSSVDDPSGTDGAMYYNSAMDTFRCYSATVSPVSGVWEDCAIFHMDAGFRLEEEFMTGLLTTGNIGSLGWNFLSNGTSTFSSNNGIAPTADRPGNFQINTGATIGNGSTVCLSRACSGAGSGSMVIRKDLVIKTAVAPGATITSNSIRVGATSQSNSSTAPAAGVWWEADVTGSGQGNWRYCFGNGVTEECANSTVAVAASTFARLEIRVHTTGSTTSTATFLINGIPYSLGAGETIDSTTRVSPNLACYTAVALARVCIIDYFQISGVSSALR